MRSNQSPPCNELEIDEISKYSILYHGPHILSILQRSLTFGEETFDTYNSYGMSRPSYSNSVRLSYI